MMPVENVEKCEPEELLKLNSQLNKIRKPKKLQK